VYVTRQKGLAFGRDWSGTVSDLGAKGCSEILPCRLYRRRGASVVRRNAVINRMEDLSVQVCKEATICKVTIVCEGGKALPPARRGRQDHQGRCWLEASARHRDAAITDGYNDRRHHEGDRMAAALGAWLPCWRGAQAPQAEALLEEVERQSDLPDC